MRTRWTMCGTTIAFSLAVASSAYPCTRSTPVSVTDMLAQADAIVRAKAVSTVDNGKSAGSAELTGLVRFDVIEIVKGDRQLRTLRLAGRLVERNDFNDHPAPYRIVRPSGRRGSCYSHEYRVDAEYLLMLKQVPGPVQWTTRWYALGPVNEQIAGADDPWLRWVRAKVR